MHRTPEAQEARKRAEDAARVPMDPTGVRRRPTLLDLFCGAGGCSYGYHSAGFDVFGVDTSAHALQEYPFDCVEADALQISLDGYDAVHASPPCLGFTGLIPREMREKHAEKWKERHKPLIAPIRDRLVAARIPFVIENVVGAVAELRDPVKIDGTMFEELAVIRPRLFETSLPLRLDRRANWKGVSLGRRTHRFTQATKDGYRTASREIVTGARWEMPGDGSWRVDAVARAGAVRTDMYYTEVATGKRFRSAAEIERYLGIRAPDPTAPALKEYFPVYGSPGRVRGSLEEWRTAMGVRWMSAKPLAQSIPPIFCEYVGRRLLEAMGWTVDYPPLLYS